ncbi:myristoylated alanine-rich C-kinase substrate [Puntigrus tetrazona]|uniref:myristoylated alanine-rich C-kinase substrate n=1 Tax=Puntigrus tetrazona TaxID=1606681 RepID=UPI001C8A8F5B|nr:myristoylated alanine-rich C-kinase substrate [Puntigrus tetrazona]
MRAGLHTSAARTHSDTPEAFPERGTSAACVDCASTERVPPALRADARRWPRQHSLKRSTSALPEEDTMGCTSSTQTTAQDTTRPNAKQDGSASGTSNENGGPAADSETLPDQTQAEESPQTSSAAPEASEEVRSSEAAVERSEPEAAAAEAAAPDRPDEPQSSPSTTAQNTEEPAPSENPTEAQAESSPPEEAPASGEDS